MPDSTVDRLREIARAVADRSHVPYSGAAVGAAVLLADGRTVAAPRLENASFPLTIPAVQGALAVAALVGDAVALASTAELTPGDVAAASQMTGRRWHLADGLAVTDDAELPPVGDAASLETDAVGDPAERALAAAERAVVPASGFPVGAVVTDADGRRAMGANVEDAVDWTRGLCAERTALVAACAAGFGSIVQVAVACPQAPGGTPCGGCRQVIAELAPDAQVVIWRGDAAPDVTSATALLPGAFGGASLGR